MGSLRHYFATQSELLCFAMQLVGDRARARIAALEPAADARRAAEQLLRELVPLDDERRAEAEVWLAFTAACTPCWTGWRCTPSCDRRGCPRRGSSP